MPLYFGHRTAELLLDRLDALPAPSIGSEFDNCCACRSDFKDFDLSVLDGIPQPYDILTSSTKDLRKWKGIRCHLCQTPLPAGSFIEISPDVFVASPPLCLILRAQELSLAQTIALGERLCGTFALDRKKRSRIRRRAPLISLEDLRSYIDRCSRVKGIARAQRAASLMLEGSASPMETISRLAFCLPKRLNGFGLPSPRMNYEMTLSQTAQELIDKSYIRIDLCWPDQGFGLEYQGKYVHGSPSAIERDVARQLAAERMGIELQMVTIEQIRNQAQRLTIAHKIASRLGITISTDQAFLTANQRLVDDLLHTSVA